MQRRQPSTNFLLASAKWFIFFTVILLVAGVVSFFTEASFMGLPFLGVGCACFLAALVACCGHNFCAGEHELTEVAVNNNDAADEEVGEEDVVLRTALRFLGELNRHTPEVVSWRDIEGTITTSAAIFCPQRPVVAPEVQALDIEALLIENNDTAPRSGL